MTILVTEPIVQILAAYMAVLYGERLFLPPISTQDSCWTLTRTDDDASCLVGIMYLTLTTFPTVWSQKYHESPGIGGLNYLALGIGFTLGTQLGARMLDTIYIKLKKKNGGVGTPEMRCVVGLVIATTTKY